MQCEHSPKTWEPVGGIWSWRCPECGIVDGFTGEKIHPDAPGSVVLARCADQACWAQADTHWYQCAGSDPVVISDPAATVADIEADAERVFA